MKKLRAVVVGYDYYAKFLAALINEHSSRWRCSAYRGTRAARLQALFDLRSANALISFGGPAPDAALVEAARRRNIPVIVIWAGSDVTKAQEDPFALELTKQERFINLSDAPWLVDELAALGIQAEYLPVTAVSAGAPVKPFPKAFRVLTYLPEPRRGFYGAEVVYGAARAMPDILFNVVGAGVRDPAAPANVRFHGLVNDMADRIDACTVVLRFPEHDGKSMLVLEALSRARHVVWNYEFPHVVRAKTPDELIAELTRLRELHRLGNLPLNQDGRRYVLDHFARADLAARFEARLDTSRTQQAMRPAAGRYRVAISGLGLFCAEVAQYAKLFTPQWEPVQLRTGSRFELLASMCTLATCDVWYSIGSPIADRWLNLTARLFRKPRVIHWVGSDIAALADNLSHKPALDRRNNIHLVEVQWTAEQLRALGLEPRIAPLPPRHSNWQAKPLPSVFTIMLYVPRTRAAFYGARAFERLMLALRGEPVRYIVVGGGQLDGPPGVEVENLGWRDNLEDAYERTSVLIRYTPRDGLSLMVLEALAFSRHVLWTQDFPFTNQVQTYHEMEEAIRKLLLAHQRGELTPQVEAAAAVQRRYAPQSCTVAIARAWSDAAGPGSGHGSELAAEAS